MATSNSAAGPGKASRVVKTFIAEATFRYNNDTGVCGEVSVVHQVVSEVDKTYTRRLSSKQKVWLNKQVPKCCKGKEVKFTLTYGLEWHWNETTQRHEALFKIVGATPLPASRTVTAF